VCCVCAVVVDVTLAVAVLRWDWDTPVPGMGFTRVVLRGGRRGGPDPLVVCGVVADVPVWTWKKVSR
jgi:hypothetical protein